MPTWKLLNVNPIQKDRLVTVLFCGIYVKYFSTLNFIFQGTSCEENRDCSASLIIPLDSFPFKEKVAVAKVIDTTSLE